MGAVAAATLKAPNKWIGGARRPHAVEFGGIPDSLVGYLRHANWVGGRAWWSICEAVACDRVVHVRLVVRAVKVFAIPASGRVRRCQYVRGARLLTRGNGGL